MEITNLDNNNNELIEKYNDLKRRIYLSTRKYALADPERTKAYSRKYYNKNKDDPEFRIKQREYAKKSYYKKKNGADALVSSMENY